MEGEAAVMSPLGGEKFEIVARIRIEQWAGLLKEAGSTLRRYRLVTAPENLHRAQSSTALAAFR
jgi:hypothetical protein